MTWVASRWSVLAGLASLLIVWTAAAAPGPGDKPEPKKGESSAEKINKALDTTGDFALQATLQNAVDQLADHGKINIVFDRFTLINQIGIDPNQVNVNVKLSGVKLRTALRSVVSQYNLGFAVIGDTVLITSEDAALHRQLRQRVSIDLDKMPAAQALKQLAKETGTNLLLDARVAKEAQTAVTLQIEDVPLDTAVRLIAEMSALKAVRIGNVMFVTNKATALELRQDPDLSQPQGALPNGQYQMERELKQLMLNVQPQPGIVAPQFLLPPVAR